MKGRSRLVVFLGIVLGLLLAFGAISCGQAGDSGGNNTVEAPDNPTPPTPPPVECQDGDDCDEITMSLGVNTCPEGAQCIVTPGVPPGTIKIAGTIESGQCWDARNLACWADRSNEVAGGQLVHSYTIRIGDPYHIVYSLANQMRVDGIRINNTPLTSFGVLGTGSSQWAVACFIPQRDQGGTITIQPNPNCTAQIRRVRLVITGDTGGSGIGSYTNGTYNMPYDDSEVPYNGDEEMRLETSYWELPRPGVPPVWQTIVWDGGMSAYTETFYSVATTQGAYFGIQHPCRDPLAPPGCYMAAFGAYLDVMPVGGGAVQCTTQLWHYIDVDLGPGFWYDAIITGINPATNCVTQDGDTRGIVVPGP